MVGANSYWRGRNMSCSDDDDMIYIIRYTPYFVIQMQGISLERYYLDAQHSSGAWSILVVGRRRKHP
jgi:hypothetical protein